MKNSLFFFMALVSTSMLVSCIGNQPQQKCADLECLGLKGKVKEVSTTIVETNGVMDVTNISFGGQKYTFDEQGALTSEDGYTFQPENLSRDAQGRLVTKRKVEVYGSDEEDYNVFETTYTYNQGNLPTVVETEIPKGNKRQSMEEYYVYNAEEEMIQSERGMNEYGNHTYQLVNNYTILQKDEKGNWIRRKVETTTVELILGETDHDWCEAKSQKSTTIEERQILYW